MLGEGDGDGRIEAVAGEMRSAAGRLLNQLHTLHRGVTVAELPAGATHRRQALTLAVAQRPLIATPHLGSPGRVPRRRSTLDTDLKLGLVPPVRRTGRDRKTVRAYPTGKRTPGRRIGEVDQGAVLELLADDPAAVSDTGAGAGAGAGCAVTSCSSRPRRGSWSVGADRGPVSNLTSR